MGKILIRKGKIGDLKSIQELNLILFGEEKKTHDPTLSMNWTFGKAGTKVFTKSLTESNRRVFVAEADGKVIGYLAGRIHPKKDHPTRTIGKLGELDNMMVLEKYRNKGAGSELLKSFLAWCEEKNAKRIAVSAFAKNTGAIGFYKKHGFKEYNITLEAGLD